MLTLHQRPLAAVSLAAVVVVAGIADIAIAAAGTVVVAAVVAADVVALSANLAVASVNRFAAVAVVAAAVVVVQRLVVAPGKLSRGRTLSTKLLVEVVVLVPSATLSHLRLLPLRAVPHLLHVVGSLRR